MRTAEAANPMKVGGFFLLVVAAVLLGFLVWFVREPEYTHEHHRQLKYGVHAATIAACFAGGVALIVLGFNDTKPENTQPASATTLL